MQRTLNRVNNGNIGVISTLYLRLKLSFLGFKINLNGGVLLPLPVGEGRGEALSAQRTQSLPKRRHHHRL
ncbi:hypothetical protein, partial [Enterobacter hormaechei]